MQSMNRAAGGSEQIVFSPQKMVLQQVKLKTDQVKILIDIWFRTLWISALKPLKYIFLKRENWRILWCNGGRIRQLSYYHMAQ